MNTINNPLILKLIDTGAEIPLEDHFDYELNKKGDQSGEYVDKELAEEMLEMLEVVKPLIESYHCQLFGVSGLEDISNDVEHPITILRSIILKARGE